jgi:hypothetical protein
MSQGTLPVWKNWLDVLLIFLSKEKFAIMGSTHFAAKNKVYTSIEESVVVWSTVNCADGICQARWLPVGLSCAFISCYMIFELGLSLSLSLSLFLCVCVCVSFSHTHIHIPLLNIKVSMKAFLWYFFSIFLFLSSHIFLDYKWLIFGENRYIFWNPWDLGLWLAP